MGFVQQVPGVKFADQKTGQAVTGTLTLVARRAVARAGTRQWRRGADTTGAPLGEARRGSRACGAAATLMAYRQEVGGAAALRLNRATGRAPTRLAPASPPPRGCTHARPITKRTDRRP